MFPILVRIDGWTVYTWGVLVGAGFLVGIELFSRQARRKGLDPRTIRNLFIVITLSAVAGARLAFVLLYRSFFVRSPAEIFFIWKGGMVFSGGLIVATVVGILYLRRLGVDVWMVSDLVAPSLALGESIGRLGCLAAGCCYGTPTTQPWGLVFSHPLSAAPRGIPLHPTQLYTSGGCLLIFFVLWRMQKSSRRKGGIICWYVWLHSLLRFVVEHFRGDYRGAFWGGTFTATQFATLLISAAFVGIWIHLRTSGEG